MSCQFRVIQVKDEVYQTQLSLLWLKKSFEFWESKKKKKPEKAAFWAILQCN